MENFEDEEFVRIILFRQDWVDATRYFESAKNIDADFVRDGLIKIGIVTYAKPFMANTGVHKDLKKYRMTNNIIPEKYYWLHEMFMNYRGNFIGHSNFKTMKPVVGPPEETHLGAMIPTQYTGISYDHWFEIDKEYPEHPVIIDEAIELTRYLIDDINISVYSNEEVFPESEKNIS